MEPAWAKVAEGNFSLGILVCAESHQKRSQHARGINCRKMFGNRSYSIPMPVEPLASRMANRGAYIVQVTSPESALTGSDIIRW